MKSPSSILALSLSTALLACAADPSVPANATTTEAATDVSDMICRKEIPTGSNIAVTKCRPREEPGPGFSPPPRTTGTSPRPGQGS